MNLIFLILSITIRNDAGVEGYYSNLRYFVTDTITRDTTVPSTELRSFWTAYLNHQHPNYTIQTENNLQFSNLDLTDWVNCHFSIPLNSYLTFNGATENEISYYHNFFPLLLDSVWNRSYVNALLKLNLDYQLKEDFTITGGDEIEHQRYFAPDSAFYNYYLNRTMLNLDIQFDDYLTLTWESKLHRLWAQTQPQHNYTEYILYLNGNSYFLRNWTLQLDITFGRRIYPARNRSYAELNPSLFINRNFGSLLGINLREDIRFLWFDETTAIYQNQLNNRLELELEFQTGSPFTLRICPQIENLRSLNLISGQDYQEISLALGVEILLSTHLWLSLDDRFGTHRYLLADSAFQSGYRFNEFTLTGSWKILSLHQQELALEMMLSITPEWHHEAIDNLAAISSTIELKYHW